MTPSRRQSLGAAAAYALLAVIVGLPALLASEPSLIGHPASDMWKHAWGHWWIHDQLAHGTLTTFTTLQNFPWGGTLFVIDPFNAAVSAALQRVLPLYAAFNIVVLGQLAFGAWAAWRLAYAVTGDGFASAVAGVVYGFSPWMLAYSVASGVSETLGIGFIPLSALVTLRAAVTASKRDAALAGLCLALAGLSSWYYLVFAVLLCAFLLLTSALGWSDALGRPRAAALRTLPLAPLVTVVLLAPLAWAFITSIQGEASLGPRDRAAFTASREYRDGFFRVTDFVIPGKSRLRLSMVVDRLAKTPYVGWVALLLAGLGLRREGRRARPWLVGAALFFMLSLGPAILITDGWATAYDVNLVYLAGRPALGFALSTSPYRIHVLTMLCVGVLAAIGLTVATKRRPALGVVVALLAFAETCWLSPAPFPMPVSPATLPPVYDGLALGETEGVLDLPPIRFGTALVPGAYYYAQTRHRGGIPYLTGGVFDPRMAGNPFFLEMWRIAAGEKPPIDLLARRIGLTDLAGHGYRWVVLHRDDLPSAQYHSIGEALTRSLGPPVTTADDDNLRWALKPVALPSSSPSPSPSAATSASPSALPSASPRAAPSGSPSAAPGSATSASDGR